MGIENLAFRLVGISRQVGNPTTNRAVVSDLERLFGRARSSIRIVSGGFPSRVYCSEEIISVLEQAPERGCSVEVIVGPEANREGLDVWTAHGVSVYVLDESPTRHFAVVDEKHVRLEEPHARGEEKRVQYIVRNFKNVGKLNRAFEELKRQAKTLELA